MRRNANGIATMDVADWLRSLGLDQYETTFRENGVDADVLPDLTDGDFEKLGVLLGHRRRLTQGNRRSELVGCSVETPRPP